MNAGPKSTAVLRIASLRISPERDRLYREACEQWSEKSLIAMFERLTDRGFIEYGVSARTGWLTEKGSQRLAELGA